MWDDFDMEVQCEEIFQDIIVEDPCDNDDFYNAWTDLLESIKESN